MLCIIVLLSTGIYGSGVPAGIDADVINEGAVFQGTFYLPQRHIFTCLQLYQVLLTIWEQESGGLACYVQHNSAADVISVRWFRPYSPTICKQPSGWTSPTSPVQNQRCPASSTQKLSFSPSPSLPKYPMATFGPPIKISPRGCGLSWLV